VAGLTVRNLIVDAFRMPLVEGGCRTLSIQGGRVRSMTGSREAVAVTLTNYGVHRGHQRSH